MQNLLALSGRSGSARNPRGAQLARWTGAGGIQLGWACENMRLTILDDRRTRWRWILPRWWTRGIRGLQRWTTRRGCRYVLSNLSSFGTDDWGCAEIGTFVHAVEGEMLCASTMPSKVRLLPRNSRLTIAQVPYFNAPIYLPTKASIGKVDEILGPINEVFFTIKCGPGITATSFTAGDKVCIGTDKLLPIERFLPQPKVATVKRGKGRGGARGGDRGRGARGSFGGGRGAPRGRGGDRGRGGGRGAPRGFSGGRGGGFGAPRGAGGFSSRGGGRGRGN